MWGETMIKAVKGDITKIDIVYWMLFDDCNFAAYESEL